jgi:hypothetical protein
MVWLHYGHSHRAVSHGIGDRSPIGGPTRAVVRRRLGRCPALARLATGHGFAGGVATQSSGAREQLATVTMPRRPGPTFPMVVKWRCSAIQQATTAAPPKSRTRPAGPESKRSRDEAPSLGSPRVGCLPCRLHLSSPSSRRGAGRAFGSQRKEDSAIPTAHRRRVGHWPTTTIAMSTRAPRREDKASCLRNTKTVQARPAPCRSNASHEPSAPGSRSIRGRERTPNAAEGDVSVPKVAPWDARFVPGSQFPPLRFGVAICLRSVGSTRFLRTATTHCRLRADPWILGRGQCAGSGSQAERVGRATQVRHTFCRSELQKSRSRGITSRSHSFDSGLRRCGDFALNIRNSARPRANSGRSGRPERTHASLVGLASPTADRMAPCDQHATHPGAGLSDGN